MTDPKSAADSRALLRFFGPVESATCRKRL